MTWYAVKVLAFKCKVKLDVNITVLIIDIESIFCGGEENVGNLAVKAGISVCS